MIENSYFCPRWYSAGTTVTVVPSGPRLAFTGPATVMLVAAGVSATTAGCAGAIVSGGTDTTFGVVAVANVALSRCSSPDLSVATALMVYLASGTSPLVAVNVP